MFLTVLRTQHRSRPIRRAWDGPHSHVLCRYAVKMMSLVTAQILSLILWETIGLREVVVKETTVCSGLNTVSGIDIEWISCRFFPLLLHIPLVLIISNDTSMGCKWYIKRGETYWASEDQIGSRLRFCIIDASVYTMRPSVSSQGSWW